MNSFNYDSFDSDGLQFAWSAHSIGLAETCLYKYFLIKIEGWRPVRKSVHLLFGGLYATAIEHYYRYRFDGMSSNEALCKVVLETLIATWEYKYAKTVDDEVETFYNLGDGVVKGTCIEGGRPWQSDHNTKTRETLIRSIVWYVDQFEDDALKTIALADGSPAVELMFTLDLGNDLILRGKLDRLVDYAGDTYVLDQKTTGTTITPRYFEGWSPDTQMSAYTFAGQALYKLPIKGVILDAAQIAVGFTRFERGFVFRSSAQLEEWYKSALYHIEAARSATREGYFPQRFSSCGNFGGCEFRSVCSRSPEVREQFLKADFVKEER